MKRIITILAIFALIFAFGANSTWAADKKPKVFKLGFMSGLSGAMANAAQTQKDCVALLVEQNRFKQFPKLVLIMPRVPITHFAMPILFAF